MLRVRPLFLHLTLVLVAPLLASGCSWVTPHPDCAGDRVDVCLGAQTLLEPMADDSCDGIEKRVCIVPLGQVSPALVKQLVEHYQSEYDLRIQVLTPSAVPRDLVNPDRGQVEGEALAQHMNSLFPDTYYNTKAVIIGLTPLDIYWAGKDWRYAFGVRGGLEDPKAVISSARMDPRTYGQERNDDSSFHASESCLPSTSASSTTIFVRVPTARAPCSITFSAPPISTA
jgi:predicted Zn-dependent protease